MKNPRHVLITGGSSGIGEALALHYAAQGLRLTLSGRNRARLDAVAAQCRELGGEVATEVIDVCDRAAMAQWIAEVDAATPLDLVIANAGVGGSEPGAVDRAENTDLVFAANVHGVFNTLHPAIDVMTPRGRGQLAIVSSIAGYLGLPAAPAYSASKVAVRAYGEALRGALHAEGLEVNVVCPGYVVSRMTADARRKRKLPFLWTADKAARVIAQGLARNKARIAFPWPLVWAVRLLQVLPASWSFAITKKRPKNGA